MEFLNEYTFAFIAGWILPSALLALLGDKRTIGFWNSLIICLIISPVLGVFAVLSSKSRQTDRLEKAMLEDLKDRKSQALSEELGQLYTLYSNGILDEDEYKKAKEKALD